MKLGAIAIIAAGLALGGCGGSGGSDTGTTTATGGSTTTGAKGAKVTGKLPAGAAGPTDTAEEAIEGPAATEASPEAEASGPHSTGELAGPDRAVATAAVRGYIAALDRRDAARVCELIAPGGIDLGELPRRRGGCRRALRASVGTRPPGGGPGLAPDPARRDEARGTGGQPRSDHRDRDPSFLRPQVRLRRGRRDLPGEGRQKLAARDTERNLLPGGRVRGAAAPGCRRACGLVARSGGFRHRGGRARAGAWGACDRRPRSSR